MKSTTYETESQCPFHTQITELSLETVGKIPVGPEIFPIKIVTYHYVNPLLIRVIMNLCYSGKTLLHTAKPTKYMKQRQHIVRIISTCIPCIFMVYYVFVPTNAHTCAFVGTNK